MNPIYVPQTPHQHRVEKFLRGIGRPVPATPQAPNPELQRTWARLLLEETLEAIEAAGIKVTGRAIDTEYTLSPATLKALQFTIESGTPDLTKLAKELADVSVVATGFMSINGIKDQMILEVVDANNQLKVDTGHLDSVTGKFMKAKDHPKPDKDIEKVLKVQTLAGE